MATEGRVSSGRFFDATTASEPPAVVSNPKLEVQARMEKKMQQEEANYSYKPTLYTKPRKEHDKIDDNRYDRLYSDALKRHLESKWKESIEDKELTFKPKISTKGATSRSASRERGAMSESIEQRLLGLTPKALQAEEYSFKPKITQRAKSIDRSQQRETPERLYLHSKTIQDKLEMKRQDLAQKNAEECTFAPKTNSRPSLSSSKSDLTERMSQYLAYKNQRLEEATKAKLDLEKENATFNPAIKLTKRSATPTKNVFDRLSVSGGSGNGDNRSVSSEMDGQHFTFKPQLVTKRAPSPGPRGEYGNIHERLFKEGVQRQKDLELERKLIQEENEGHLTFTPAINRKSSFTNKSMDESTASSQQPQGPVFERLSSTNNRLYMQEVLTKIKTDLELKDCTFKPKLVSENKATNRESSSEPIYLRLEKEGERVKAEQARQKEAREAEALKDATFTPQINVKSNSFAKKRVSNADIYTRLNAEKPVVPEPTVVEAPKKVLPKEDVEKIFRRLSITNTVSTEVANTYRATGELPESPEHKQIIQRKKSIVLPEKDIDSLFTRLHTTSYDHEEAEPVKPAMKQATPRQVNEIVDRLSKNPAEAWLENQSPRRSSRILMGLGSPSNDSYEANSLSSSVVGTPRGEGRKDSFRDPAATHSTPTAAASNIHPGDFPPTPPARVQPANKFANGNNTSSGNSSSIHNGIAAAAGAPASPAAATVVEGVAALPKPPSHIPVATTPKASTAAPPVAPTTPKATPAAAAPHTPIVSQVPAPAYVPPPAAVSANTAPVPVAATTTTTSSAHSTNKSSAAKNSAAGSSGAASGASAPSNPDFFSKLEASLAFLETQLDTKTSAKSPGPKTGSSAAAAATSSDPAPSYASVVKS